jgi:thymidylate synthase (FAD)
LRKSGTTNRQSSSEVFNPIIDGNIEASRLIETHLKESEDLYKSLLNAGVAKECARFVLPLTTQTKIYMKGSVRSWIHYLQIRCDGHTQLEHQQIALNILDVFKTNFPNISKALEL